MNLHKRVDILCDGSDQIGFGHIRRSSTLAEQLRKDGVEVRVVGLSNQAEDMLPHVVEDDRTASLIIFDSPSGIDNLINSAHKRDQVTLTLDWFGKTIPDVNIAVYPHDEVRAKHQSYVGFEFIMVRDEIRLQGRVAPSNDVSHVLVVLGGGDVMGQGHSVARHLSDLGLEVTLVQGPLAKNVDEGENYRVLVNPPQLAEIMASCDWAVTNGGGCLFEMLFLGKATVVLPQTESEMKIASYVKERGAVLGIGQEEVCPYQLDEILPVVLNANNLVDGHGAERISNIVQGLL